MAIFLLVFVVGILAGIFGYLNAKITTFEECENSWLARSITIYDYAEYVPNAIQRKCTLWIGKSFEKRLELPNFGNDYAEKAITDYLLTRKKLIFNLNHYEN